MGTLKSSHHLRAKRAWCWQQSRRYDSYFPLVWQRGDVRYHALERITPPVIRERRRLELLQQQENKQEQPIANQVWEEPTDETILMPMQNIPFFITRKIRPLNILAIRALFTKHHLLLPPKLVYTTSSWREQRRTNLLLWLRLACRGGRIMGGIRTWSYFTFFFTAQNGDLFFSPTHLPIFGLNWFRLTKREKGIYKVRSSYGFRWFYLPPFQRIRWFLHRLWGEFRYLDARTALARYHLLLTQVQHPLGEGPFRVFSFYNAPISLLVQQYRHTLLLRLRPQKYAPPLTRLKGETSRQSRLRHIFT